MITDHLFFTGINILLAWSVYLILLSGTMSFGNGGFMAIGAYCAGFLTKSTGLPLELALIGATGFCTLIGIVIGYPALRTRGLYLILVTIGLAFSVRVVIENLDFVGGVKGMGGLYGTTLFHVAACLLVAGGLLFAIERSPLQRLLDAVREDEMVAGTLGINVVYLRIAAFAAGAGLAGLAGALYGHYMIFIAPDHFGIIVSIFVVLYVILGGTNTMWGPVLGATLMTLLPEFIRPLAEWRILVFSVLLIVLLYARPEGILSFRVPTARAGARK